MKNFNLLVSGILVLFICSCASVSRFPVSQVTPAAQISAKKQQDKSGNTILELKAKNLASPERLTPPKSVYVLWVVTPDDGIRNVGQLNIENAGSAKFKTLTPFDFTEVFITAEDQGTTKYPQGIEIVRTSFNK